MRYRRVDSMFWNDEKVRALTDDGKLAFLFVLTHPQLTALGAMRATLPGLAAELGWPQRRLAAALKPAIESGMLECDVHAAFVALPNFLTYNGPQVRNHFRAWIAALALLPECDGKERLLIRCREYLEKIPDAVRKAIPDVIAHVMGHGMPHSMPDDMPHRNHHGEGEGEGDGDGKGDGEGKGVSPLPPSWDRSNGQRRRPSRRDATSRWIGHPGGELRPDGTLIPDHD